MKAYKGFDKNLRGLDSQGELYIKYVKSAKVDGKKIKADTFYILRDGKFMEVE